MKTRHHYQPPRQSVIYGYTRRMLDETATDATTFSMCVAEKYLATTAPDVRQVKLRLGEGAELMRAMDNNGQILRRYMDGTVKVLPADLEDAWVLALPEPYRSDCERDLALRRGVLSVKLVGASEAAEVVTLGELAHDFGDLFQALSVALVNGRITETDLPHALRIINESDDLVAAVLRVRCLLVQMRPEAVASG